MINTLCEIQVFEPSPGGGDDGDAARSDDRLHFRGGLASLDLERNNYQKTLRGTQGHRGTQGYTQRYSGPVNPASSGGGDDGDASRSDDRVHFRGGLASLRPRLGQHPRPEGQRERELLIDDLLVRIHLIIEMTLVDRPCAMEFKMPFPCRLISTFL